jgi:glycosyltransferase involved in cell wall biosynthesis
LPLRRLLAGPAAAPDRILYSNIWFHDHVNRRSEELLPRLQRVDACLLVCPRRQPFRNLVFHALYRGRPVIWPLLLGAGSGRYRHLFTTDVAQIASFRGPVVADVDDPTFSPREVELIGRPNVAAVVVTAERAGRRLEELGLRAPWHVIPQGASVASLRPEDVEEVRRRRRDGEAVVGFVAAWLRTDDDRDGHNPLYNVEHLLELWDEIRTRAPARLWLVGGASDRLRERLAGRDDVVLFGRVPPARVLAHVANFDIALYARTQDQGVRSAKVAEYMGLGVPTVSYDYRVTEVLRETGAGVLVREPREFVDAVVALASEPERRAAVAAAAARAGRELDWDVLARRYEREILDRYLPPDAAVS